MPHFAGCVHDYLSMLGFRLIHGDKTCTRALGYQSDTWTANTRMVWKIYTCIGYISSSCRLLMIPHFTCSSLSSVKASGPISISDRHFKISWRYVIVGEDRGRGLGGKGRGTFDEMWAGGWGQMGGEGGGKNLILGEGYPKKHQKKRGGGRGVQPRG